MKSRITIEIDFDNGNTPIIQIASHHSEDVRDKLISEFLVSLQHTSRWCRIEYLQALEPGSMWKIIPLKPSELESEIALMNAVLAESDKKDKVWREANEKLKV